MSSVGTGVELAASVKALLALTAAAAAQANADSNNHNSSNNNHATRTSERHLVAPVAKLAGAEQAARNLERKRAAALATRASNKSGKPATVQGQQQAPASAYQATKRDENSGGTKSVGAKAQQQQVRWYRKLAFNRGAQVKLTKVDAPAAGGACCNGKRPQRTRSSSARQHQRKSSIIGHASSNLVGKLMYMIKKSSTLSNEFSGAGGGAVAPATNPSGQPKQTRAQVGAENSVTKISSAAADSSLPVQMQHQQPAPTIDRRSGSSRYRLSELGRRFVRHCKQSKAVQFATRNIKRKQQQQPKPKQSHQANASDSAGGSTPPSEPPLDESSVADSDKCRASACGDSVTSASASASGCGGGSGGESGNGLSVSSAVARQSAKRTAAQDQQPQQQQGDNSSEEVYPSEKRGESIDNSNTNSTTMNLATSLATVTNRFHCSASVGNLLSSYGGQQQRRELAELSGDSHLDGIKPLDYALRGTFDQYPDDADDLRQRQPYNQHHQYGGSTSSRSSTNNIKDPLGQQQRQQQQQQQLGSQSCTKSQYLAVDSHSAGSASVSRKSSAKEKRNKHKDAERVEKLRLLVSYLKSGTSQQLLAPVTLDSEEIELAQKYKQHMILCEFCLQGAEQQLEQNPNYQVRSSASSNQLMSSSSSNSNNHDHHQQSNHLNHHTTSHHLNHHDQLNHHCIHHLHLNQHNHHDQSSPTDQGDASGQGGLTMSAKPFELQQQQQHQESPQTTQANRSGDEVDQNKSFLSSCRSVPQNLATWIDNEVNSLVHDLEAQSQLLVRNEKHAQNSSGGGKRKWLSSGSRRNSSGALST